MSFEEIQTKISAFERLNTYLDCGNDMYDKKSINLQIEVLRELENKVTGVLIVSCKESFQKKVKNEEIVSDIFFQSLKLVRMINHQYALLSIIASADELIDDPKKKSILENFASTEMKKILEHDNSFSKLMRSILFTMKKS